ncbi:hypothetical protein [Halobiforma nitratireducens]|uniref:Uncharacterized protein n=1 Tax=Halobiforma nitratireducens JCM 10879 TaxID=1227454 RepID=M0LBH8_9EURY|nr:hypothetical protein [Halobiforma nitratireducens]EMA30917.1 hypothetical protein C446_16340 [Halobiforma nitratireducens JCM 10879]
MTPHDSGRSSSGLTNSSRRAFLTGVGTATGAVLAGCSELPGMDDSDTSVQFAASEVDDVLVETELTPPEVRWPVPVEPAPAAVDDALERVASLVAEVPESLTPDDVPNGVVRAEIGEQRDEATARRDELADATGTDRYRAYRQSREAREAARHAATSWLAIGADREELVAELRDEYSAARTETQDRYRAIDYRGPETGEGRLRTVLYAFRRESDLRSGTRTLERWGVSASDDVLETGESASTLEHTTATVDVWDHLEERYRSQYGGDDAADLAPVFEGALEQSIEAADAADVPRQNDGWLEEIGLGDLDDSILEFLVWRAGQPIDRARDGMADARDDADWATGLYRALEFEVAYRALETVRDRVADGELAEPTVEDVLAERSAALEAAETVRNSEIAGERATAPSLGAYALAERLRSVGWVDDGVRRAADRSPDTNVSLRSQYRDYVRYRAQLEALPDALEAFRGRLLE